MKCIVAHDDPRPNRGQDFIGCDDLRSSSEKEFENVHNTPLKAYLFATFAKHEVERVTDPAIEMVDVHFIDPPLAKSIGCS